MDAATLTALLEDVKVFLGVTWSDNFTDNRLTMLIEAGAAYLNQKNGETADYTASGLPRSLLFEYVRYARDGALDVFENNYRSMILAMGHERMVNQNATQSAAQAET